MSLVKELLPDLKNLVVWGAAFIGKLYSVATRRRFDSPQEFLHFCMAGDVEPGQLVEVTCKPSPFGPYLRTHFLSPIIGMSTGHRRGPPIVSNNPMFALMGQALSHLTPVGLAPPIEIGVDQVTLYPIDSPAVGFVSILPQARNLVVSAPALATVDLARHYGQPIVITGRAAYVNSAVLVESGFMPEEYEALRQAGRVWFLDCTEELDVIEMPADEDSELWGGLYAQGHLEIDGALPVDAVIAAIRDSMNEEGFQPQIVENQAEATRDFGLYAEGFRGRVSVKAPVYSLHMDVELNREFGESRAAFDRITSATLTRIANNAAQAGVAVANAGDLDFTYTDTTTLYSVLRSGTADNIADPVALAIRDWHRLRGRERT